MALLERRTRWAVIAGIAYTASVLGSAAWVFIDTGRPGPALVILVVFSAWAIPLAMGCLQLWRHVGTDDTTAESLSLQRRHQDLPPAGEAKGVFLAKMSHEIRTPLNGIIGMTEIALSTRLDDNQRRIIGVIENESNHLLDLINNVLDFSKIEAGKLTMETIDFDLRRLMDGVGELIGVQAARKGLEMNLFQSPDVPRRLTGDPTRLRQVLLNLAGNSVKFTWEGEITIRAELASRQSDRATVRFTIEDTGIGIAVADQTDVFESFTQADMSTTRTYGGTGLGTTISKSLVALMGGRMHMVSDVGLGTTVSFELPFGVPAEVPDQDDDCQNTQLGLNVLLVDDCFTSRQFAHKYLDVLGCRTQGVEDGHEALKRLADEATIEDPFDLIITDFRMPKMSGYELARQVRTMERYRQTPIIAVTALQEIASGEDFRSLGFDRCLSKPLAFDDLKSAIVEVIHQPRPESPESLPLSEQMAPPRRILLAEDYPANQQVVMMHLAEYNCTVDLAENGLQAVDLFSQNRYDLILMDLEMPLMDGYAATRAIRRIEAERLRGTPSDQRGAIPIIALTAHALKGHETRSRQAGMDAFITKPLRRRRLIATIEEFLSPDSEASYAVCPSQDHNTADLPMDWDQVLSEFLYQEEVLNQVITEFLCGLPGQLSIIDQALEAGDEETARKTAHAIKGGGANLCAMPLSEAAAQVEQASSDGDLEKAAKALVRLVAELERLQKFWIRHTGDASTPHPAA